MIEHWGSITASIVAQCFLVFIIRFLIGSVLLCRFIESLISVLHKKNRLLKMSISVTHVTQG